MDHRPIINALLATLLLNHAAIAGERPAEEGTPPPAPESRHTVDDSARRLRGTELFRQHCAQCHGERAEGAPDWRKRLPDGLFPPPPLNGSGHAWHHPESELKEVILFGRNRMPAWNGKLGRRDVDDLVAWFQSLWPEENYRIWEEANARTKKGAQARQ